MSEHRFVLYYWPLPFRAQSARYLLVQAGLEWEEPEPEAVMALYQQDGPDQPAPFMGPPVLHDRETELWVSQLPAIVSYLGEVLDLMPGNPVQDALTHKVVSDCVDVLHELTRNCGQQMWDVESWTAFSAERLPQWLEIFEEMGRRHRLSPKGGTLLGSPGVGVADLASAALWISICDSLPPLEEIFTRHMPLIMAHARRIAGQPAFERLRTKQRARWGDAWCGGDIEASLRAVIG